MLVSEPTAHNWLLATGKAADSSSVHILRVVSWRMFGNSVKGLIGVQVGVLNVGLLTGSIPSEPQPVTVPTPAHKQYL